MEEFPEFGGMANEPAVIVARVRVVRVSRKHHGPVEAIDVAAIARQAVKSFLADEQLAEQLRVGFVHNVRL